MKPTRRQLVIRKDLQRRFDTQEARHRKACKENHPECLVRADAIAIGCASVRVAQLKNDPEWHCYEDRLLKPKKPSKFLPYRRIARFKSTKTTSKFWVYYQKLGKQLPPYRVEFFPRDQSGLIFPEISSVLEHARNPRISRLEIAFDFGLSTGVDRAFVRRYFISGKSKRELVDGWGNRKSTKFIRSYFKREIGAHRVEIQFNLPFLRGNHIDTVFDFMRLAGMIPKRHFYFAKINYPKAIKYLRVTRTAEEAGRIMEKVHAQRGDLLAQLAVLKGEGQLANTGRLLIPLKKNQLVRDALKAWAAQWPSSPAPLGSRP